MSDTKRRLRPSPSIIISVFALVIAMSAGAYAVTIAPKNSVVSKSIKNGQVKAKDIASKAVNSKKIKDGQVLAADIGDGQVGSADIGDGQVGTADLANVGVTGPKLAPGSVDSGKIVDGSIGLGDLASDAQSKAYFSQTKDFLAVSTTDTTFESLNLPAGKFVLYARAVLNSNAAGTQTWDCQLTSGGEQVDMVNNVRLAANLAAGERESITLMAAATVAAPATVDLQCRVDAGNGNVFWPSVSAVTVQNIEVQ